VIKQFSSYPVRPGHKITSVYGARRLPGNESVPVISFHSGIDFWGGADRDILAVDHGMVYRIQQAKMYGMTLIVEHECKSFGRIYSVYCHLEDSLVSAGSIVEPGQVIGVMGNTGNFGKGFDSIHLHFQCQWKFCEDWGANDPNIAHHYDPLASLPAVSKSGMRLGAVDNAFRNCL
jgi:murein DD-endopeptidase MepM/ murein hydrolase activator NlpD